MSEENNIRVSCKLENLAVIRVYLREVLANLQIDELVRDQIVLAVDEVCANLIVHSNKADVTQHIELSLTVSQTPKGVLIELRESGEIFDYHNYKEPLLEELIESKKAGHLGLILVRRIMDQIDYYKQGNQNICRLYKSLT